ncbi:YhdT family protein [Ornithinimicrobium pratense]|uniref:YhdT family protein n=1 Tax=Ornithinimicrobium pratense TaxID=2593973 RepID=A0A5J6V466_9MICO|nr:YhdT family protein [Ornithinimicrobium pratense]QFG68427.1 YhdT family protein [Ornithinimicrobium pratense]
MMSSHSASSSATAEDFEEDPRYRISQREALMCLTYWVVYTACSVTVAWLLGNRDSSEIGFVLGFPDWFFWSAIGVTAVFATVVPYLMVRLAFTDVDLEPRPRYGHGSETEVPS